MRIPKEHPEFDFEHDLPAGKEFFSVPFLARLWGCSNEHVIGLIESGEIAIAADLRGTGSTKTMWRVTRRAVVDFLNRRKSGIAMGRAAR